MNKMIKIITTLIFVTILAACGGSGSGSTGPSYTADFTAAGGGGAQSVTLQKGSVSGATVYVNIVVTEVNNLYGADIRLSYDAAKVKWGGSYEAGTVLEAKEVTVNYLVRLSGGSEGTVLVGASRQGEVDSVPTATGVLVTIPFTVIATGLSDIDFAVTDLYDNAPSSVTVLSTSGGVIDGV